MAEKRFAPRSFLFWLQTNVRPNYIDTVICTELPNQQEDPTSYDIVRKNMIHGPCGPFNNTVLCMKNEKHTN